MKKFLLSLIVISLVMTSCKDKVTDHFTANIPQYMDYETLRSSVEYTSPKSINTVSGIYLHDQYLLLIEPMEGIHIMDNTNHDNPVNIGFIKMPGVSGMEINGGFLFADSFVDLVVLNISDMQNPIEVNRSMDHFKTHSMANYSANHRAEQIDYSKGVVISWELGETSVEVTDYNYNISSNALLDASFSTESSFSTGINISGSITKFSILGDYLYVMNENSLKPFNIANPLSIQPADDVYIPFTVETLFDYNDHLFIGTTTGMLIYNNIDPETPEMVSVFRHMNSCDPVVVQGDIAYVTLRSGNLCGGNTDQLDVIDVSDYSDPILLESFDMDNPHGLGIDDNLLFICDGDAGLKIFDASNPNDVGNELIANFPDITAIDVIPFNNTAMIFGEDGLRQYDYSDINNVYELSFIPFN